MDLGLYKRVGTWSPGAAAILVVGALAGCGSPEPGEDAPQPVKAEQNDPVEVARLLGDRPEVPDGHLAELRGGFVFGANGMIVRFGLETSTRVNGDLVATSSLSGLDRLASQTVIEVAEPGVSVSQSSLRDVTGALTVIRNVVPDTVIDHITRVTVDIANFSPERNALLNLQRDTVVQQ